MPTTKIIEWIKRQAGAALHEAEPELPVALHFGDATAEAESLRDAAALLPSPRWAQFLVEGKDAADYLHRRLTQSIKKIPLGAGAQALLLDGEGRMQGDLLVYRGNEALMLITEREHAQALYDLIDRYILMDQVELTPFWQSEALVTLAGPKATSIIGGLIDPRPAGGELAGGRWCGYFTVNLSGLPCRIFGDGRFSVPLYHLSIPPMALDQMLATLAAAVKDRGGSLAGELAMELLRIESGVPRFGRDTNNRTIPLEAGLTGTIDFDKGCYPGQEFLARIRNLGRPAHALARITMHGEHAPGEGAPLWRGDEEIGRLASSITWPGLGRTAGLGYLNWKARHAGSVEIDSMSGRAAAKSECLIPDGLYKE